MFHNFECKKIMQMILFIRDLYKYAMLPRFVQSQSGVRCSGLLFFQKS